MVSKRQLLRLRSDSSARHRRGLSKLKFETLDERLFLTAVPGVEVREAQTVTGSSVGASFVNVPGLSTPSMVIDSSNPVRLSASLNLRNTSTGPVQVEARFVRDGGGTLGPTQRFWLEPRDAHYPGTGGSDSHIQLEDFVSVPSGSHTFQLQVRESSGNGALFEFSNSATQSINAMEVNSIPGVGPGAEVREAQTVTGSSVGASFVNVPGLSTPSMVIDSSNPVRLSASLNLRNTSTGPVQVEARFVRDGGGTLGPTQRFWLEPRDAHYPGTGGSDSHIQLEDFVSVPSGSHTFQLQVRESSGNGALFEFSNSATQSINAMEVNSIPGVGPGAEVREAQTVTGSSVGASFVNVPGLSTPSMVIDSSNPVRLSASLNLRNTSTGPVQVEARFVRDGGGTLGPTQRFWLEPRDAHYPGTGGSDSHIQLEDFVSVPSGSHTFQLQVRESSGNGALFEFSNSATQSINAVEFLTRPDPKIEFSQSGYFVNESGSPFGLPVTLVRSGNTAVTSQVLVGLSNGTASGGAGGGPVTDFNSNPILVTFLPNQTSNTVVVPITQDNVVETDETVHLSLVSAVSNASFGPINSATLQILDDDTATFTIDDVSVNEAAGTLDFTLALSNPIDSAADLEVSFTDGSTIAGDFDHTTQTVNFPALNNANQTVSVPITNDNIVELTENFTASLAVGTATPLGARSVNTTDSGSGEILDNDTATFTIDDVSVNEAAGTLDFTLALSNPIDSAADLEVSFTDGSTIAGDFDHTTQTVNFPALNNANQTVSVPITNDNIVELTENFTASLAVGAATPFGAQCRHQRYRYWRDPG